MTERLIAAARARDSGDLVSAGRASERVLALGLAQMARIRMDAREYNQAIELCQKSLEFEDSAQTRVELAIVSLYAKKKDEAIEQASTAARMDPSSGLAWTVQGEALLEKKDYEKAIIALGRAVEIKRETESLYSLGIAYLGAGEPTKASEEFSEVLKLAGDAGWSRVLIGRAYEEQGFSKQAIQEFQAAIRLDSSAPNAHYYWGRALLRENGWGPTPEARAQLEEELKLHPRHFLANYLLGIFDSIERNYEASDRHLRVAAELNPGLPESWMYLGLNASARDDRQSAERYFRRAVALREKLPEPKGHLSVRKAYIGLGRILLTTGRKQEGEELMRKAREMQFEDLSERQEKIATIKSKEGTGVPGAVSRDVSDAENQASHKFEATAVSSSPAKGESTDSKSKQSEAEAERQLRVILGSAYNDLATAEALQKKDEPAVEHYEAASAWDSKVPGLKRNLALAYFYGGRPAKAAPLLEKILAQKPGDAQARAIVAECYFADNQFEKVLLTLSPASRAAIRDARLGYILAKSLAETGRRGEAAVELKRIESMDQDSDVELLLERARLWKQLGKLEPAAQCYRQVLLKDTGNNEAKCALQLTECKDQSPEK